MRLLLNKRISEWCREQSEYRTFISTNRSSLLGVKSINAIKLRKDELEKVFS